MSDIAANAKTLMMDINPYASPHAVNEPVIHGTGIYVDGPYLVVHNNAVLPQRCIITNEPAMQRDRRSRTFIWAPSFRLVLRRQRCNVTYYVARKHRMALYRKRAIIWIASMLVGSIVLGYDALWIVPFITLAVGGMSVKHLRVKRERNGQFWFTGFGDEFLKSCETEHGHHPS